MKPSLSDVLQRLAPKARSKILPLLPGLPLLYLLNEILDLALKSDQASRRALLDLAELAVDRHDYTRCLRRRLADACRNDGAERSDEVVSSLPAEDALLAMEILGFLAERFADSDEGVAARRCFECASDIADRFALSKNKPVVQHQLALHHLRQNEVALAERALQNAEQGFRTNDEHGLADTTRQLRRALFFRLLERDPDAALPEDLTAELEKDPRVGTLRLLAQVRLAIDRDDLTQAEQSLRELRTRTLLEDELRARVYLQEARLMRRMGQFEQADFLRNQAARLVAGQAPSVDLLWEKFYFARDVGLVDRAERALIDLAVQDEDTRVAYQTALIAIQKGDADGARSLLEGCLAKTASEAERAGCLAMLAQLIDEPAKARSYLAEAIGLYVKLGKDLDHAQCLSQLAMTELSEVIEWIRSGIPPDVVFLLSRADRYLKQAEAMAEELGVDPFLVELRFERARLEAVRGRGAKMIQHFERALAHLEVVYLRLSDRNLYEQYARRYTAGARMAAFYALALNRADDAYLFAERSKARRLLRDLAEIWAPTDEGGAAASENFLLADILPLRKKILAGNPLTTAERACLHQAEESFLRLSSPFQSLPTARGDSETILWQPLGVAALRGLVFGDEAHADAASETTPREVPSGETASAPPFMVGEGGIECPRCHVLNATGSSFCSACEELLPRSVAIDMNLLTGQASKEDLTISYAAMLYNKAIAAFACAKYGEAEQGLEEALQHHTHPDYLFFLGMCRLRAGDGLRALDHFRRIQELQFAGERPFWPLPVSPSQLKDACHLLEAGEVTAESVFLRLNERHQAFLRGRSHATREGGAA